jgi:hypothetical protein
MLVCNTLTYFSTRSTTFSPVPGPFLRTCANRSGNSSCDDGTKVQLRQEVTSEVQSGCQAEIRGRI